MIDWRHWGDPATARIRLICLPYAGGSASIFHVWQRSLPADVSISAPMLPGRGRLATEPLLEEMAPLIEATDRTGRDLLRAPYVIYGHSMGALMAFAVERILEQRGHRARVVFAGAQRAAGQIEPLNVASREIGTVLDAADWMSGSYRLELTSPGLDRVLGREKDFEAAAAARSVVKLQTRRPLDGRRLYRGVLIGFADATAQVEVDGTVFAVPFDEIEKANTVYEFTSADFKDRAKTE